MPLQIAMYNSRGRLIERKGISAENLATLESALIQSEDVEFEYEVINMIDEKVVRDFRCNPFNLIPQEQILRFIEQSALPHDSKKTLSALTLSSCGELLFLSTIRKLSLEKAFFEFASNWLAIPTSKNGML